MCSAQLHAYAALHLPNSKLTERSSASATDVWLCPAVTSILMLCTSSYHLISCTLTQLQPPPHLLLLPPHPAAGAAVTVGAANVSCCCHAPEGLDLHGELADGVRQCCVQLIVRPAVKQSLQALLPAVKRLQQQQQQQQQQQGSYLRAMQG
jgi:hypothetical protein